MNLDSSLLPYVIQLRRPWLDDVMIVASAIGAGGFVWIIFGSIAGISEIAREAFAAKTAR